MGKPVEAILDEESFIYNYAVAKIKGKVNRFKRIMQNGLLNSERLDSTIQLNRKKY